jgi:hypothetical protein
MTPELESMPDAQLAEVFAVECAGWTKLTDEWRDKHFWSDKYKWLPAGEYPAVSPVRECFFATSADAVLTFLEAARDWRAYRDQYSEVIRVSVGLVCVNIGVAPTFARAACIALIRAKRAQKGAV